MGKREKESLLPLFQRQSIFFPPFPLSPFSHLPPVPCRGGRFANRRYRQLATPAADGRAEQRQPRTSFPFSPFPRFPHLTLALIAVLLAGCAQLVVPVLMPVKTGRVKPGRPDQALVVLPDGGAASVYLHFIYISGRVNIQRVGVVNHAPGKVTILNGRTRIYVDDGEPLTIYDLVKLESRAHRTDFHILKELPEEATGTWLMVKRRFVTQKTIRGPTVVLVYRVKGQEGFVKVRYRPIWEMPE